MRAAQFLRALSGLAATYFQASCAPQPCDQAAILRDGEIVE